METVLVRYTDYPEMFAEAPPAAYAGQRPRLRFGYVCDSEWAEVVVLEGMTLADCDELLNALSQYRELRELDAAMEAEAQDTIPEETPRR